MRGRGNSPADEAKRLHERAERLGAAFERRGRPADVEAAIGLLRRAVAITPHDAPERAGHLVTLGAMLGRRYGVTGDDASLTEAISVTRAALDLIPAGDGRRVIPASNLGAMLVDRYERTGDPAICSEAVRWAREAVEATPDRHPDLAGGLSNLSLALWYADSRSEAAETARQAVTAARPGTDEHTRLLVNLAVMLVDRYDQTGDPALLDESVATTRAAADGTPDDHPELGKRLGNAGLALMARYERTADTAALDEAVARFRRAARVLPAGHPFVSVAQHNLGRALLRLHARTLAEEPLHEALRVTARALEAGDLGPVDRALYLSTYADAFAARYQLAGDDRDLETAVLTARQALAAVPQGHRDRAVRMTALADKLTLHQLRHGGQQTLDEVLWLRRQAVAAAPPGEPLRSALLVQLAEAVLAHAGPDGDVPAEAVEAARQAVASAPEGHPLHTRCLRTLAMLLDLYDTGPESGEEASDVLRRLRQAPVADADDRHGVLLARALLAQTHLERTGDATELDEVVGEIRGELSGLPAGHLRATPLRSMLSAALTSRLDHAPDPGLLDELAELARQQIRSYPDGHPSLSLPATALGLALRSRYEATGDRDTLAESLAWLKTAAELPDAAELTRIPSAGLLGTTAESYGLWPIAAEAGALAVELLSRAASRTLPRPDAEHILAEHQDLARSAAASALQNADPQGALTVLELGRGVLIAQALETRTDLTDLSRDHPAPAGRFVRLRETLDGLDAAAPPRSRLYRLMLSGPEDPAAARADQQRLAERRKAAREWQDLLTTVRGLPGHERFLLAPTPAELAAQAADGPIVTINVAGLRCDALVLTSEGVTAVPLPLLGAAGVEEQTRTFLAATRVAGRPGAGIAERLRAERQILTTLAWLWDTTAEPVLTALGRTTTPAPGTAWPRVWWAAAGPLALLPVHAAGHHEEYGQPHPRTVMDRVVSSHTPTVRALAHARTPRPAGRRPGGILAVAMPRTEDAQDLPRASEEAGLLTARFPGARVLTGEQATRDGLLVRLRSTGLLHFACHADSDPADPSGSRLLLHDHKRNPLTVLDISRLRLENAELAYLSACATGRGAGRLADEAIHLTSAFLLAGFRHVIGTLWPVEDDTALTVAHGIYDALADPRQDTGPGQVATVLHGTTRNLRNRYPRSPSLWAAHIHAGP